MLHGGQFLFTLLYLLLATEFARPLLYPLALCCTRLLMRHTPLLYPLVRSCTRGSYCIRVASAERPPLREADAGRRRLVLSCGSKSFQTAGSKLKPSNRHGVGPAGISCNCEKTFDLALHVVKYRRYFTEGNA